MKQSATTSSIAPAPLRWSKSLYHQMGESGRFEGKHIQLIEGEIVSRSLEVSRNPIPAEGRYAEVTVHTFDTSISPLTSANGSVRVSDLML